MILNDKSGLKLIGKNKEDLKIISAYLQDSIVTLKNLAFLKKNRIFVMIVNRFMWEDVEKGVFRKNKRIKCAVKFDEVIKVGSKNINQNNKNKILECLAIKCNLLSDDTYDIKIFFSGGSVITIISETIDIILDDFGEPWNVKHVPSHKI
tara:strand:+ start:551 stop:1000 length:450 start_codon:yes stop_codon:yes gene_type:complete